MIVCTSVAGRGTYQTVLKILMRTMKPEGWEMKTTSIETVFVYRYHLSWLRGIFRFMGAILFLGFVALVTMGAAYVEKLAGGETTTHVGSFVFGGFIVLIAIYRFSHDFVGALRSATIVVDDKGISSRIAGVKAKRIAWRDVEKIVKVRSATKLFGYLDSFEVVSKKQIGPKWLLLNLVGNIVFTKSLRECKDLVTWINFYAQENEIPQFFSNAEAPLLGEDGTLGRQWSIRPPEVSVARF